jgi:colicin import membrane protein
VYVDPVAEPLLTDAREPVAAELRAAADAFDAYADLFSAERPDREAEVAARERVDRAAREVRTFRLPWFEATWGKSLPVGQVLRALVSMSKGTYVERELAQAANALRRLADDLEHAEAHRSTEAEVAAAKQARSEAAKARWAERKAKDQAEADRKRAVQEAKRRKLSEAAKANWAAKKAAAAAKGAPKSK